MSRQTSFIFKYTGKICIFDVHQGLEASGKTRKSGHSIKLHRRSPWVAHRQDRELRKQLNYYLNPLRLGLLVLSFMILNRGKSSLDYQVRPNRIPLTWSAALAELTELSNKYKKSESHERLFKSVTATEIGHLRYKWLSHRIASRISHCQSFKLSMLRQMKAGGFSLLD